MKGQISSLQVAFATLAIATALAAPPLFAQETSDEHLAKQLVNPVAPLVSVPFQNVTKLTSIGTQRVSLGGGLRYYADSPETGPHGWGVRLTVTFVFPKK